MNQPLIYYRNKMYPTTFAGYEIYYLSVVFTWHLETIYQPQDTFPRVHIGTTGTIRPFRDGDRLLIKTTDKIEEGHP